MEGSPVNIPEEMPVHNSPAHLSLVHFSPAHLSSVHFSLAHRLVQRLQPDPPDRGNPNPESLDYEPV
jgi:hypothetical protein